MQNRLEVNQSQQSHDIVNRQSYFVTPAPELLKGIINAVHWVELILRSHCGDIRVASTKVARCAPRWRCVCQNCNSGWPHAACHPRGAPAWLFSSQVKWTLTLCLASEVETRRRRKVVTSATAPFSSPCLVSNRLMVVSRLSPTLWQLLSNFVH